MGFLYSNKYLEFHSTSIRIYESLTRQRYRTAGFPAVSIGNRNGIKPDGQLGFISNNAHILCGDKYNRSMGLYGIVTASDGQ